MYSSYAAADTLTPGSQYGVFVYFYSSESCSQVFTIVLAWLMTVVEDLPREEWSRIVLAYDNMCHLDSLKVARKPFDSAAIQ